jgi:phosphomannomutase
VMALAKLLELLARTGTRLSDVVDELPSINLARVEVPTPWEVKALVMRRLIERTNGERTDTTDGVKTYRGRDWALVVPHPTEPVIRVWAEAGSPEDASALAEEFVRLVEELRD